MKYKLLYSNLIPFPENLRVGFHQIIWDVITCQILEDVSSWPLNLKNNKLIRLDIGLNFLKNYTM